jgi:hypothetical protein
VKVDQATARDSKARAEPARGPDRTADVDAALDALVRLLALQAAREHLQRQADPEAEEITDEG